MSPPYPAGLVAQHRAVFAAFALNGAVFASWASRIPTIKAELGLDTRALGLLLLAGSLGSIVGLPISGALSHRIGTRRAVLAGATVAVLGVAGVGLATSLVARPVAVGCCLFLTGLGVGLWDVAMNLQGAQVERALGRYAMPHYHAMFSAGTVAAALISAGLVALAVPLAVHLCVVAALTIAAVFWATTSFASAEPPAAAGTVRTTRSAWLQPRTLLIGVVVLIAAFTEGTANDWISLAFVEGHGVPSWAGVLAFAVFLTAMTCGRLLGPRLLERYGRVPVLRIMFTAAVLGSLLVVFAPPVVAFVGTAIWGVGVSLGFPVGMSAAADDPAQAHARMSVVSTIGYTAFLAGPPLLGLLGHEVGVLRALLVVGVAAIVALICLPAVREPDVNLLNRR